MRLEHQRLMAVAVLVVGTAGVIGSGIGLYSTILSLRLPSVVREAVQAKLNDPAIFSVNDWDKITDSVYCVEGSYVNEDLKTYSRNDWYMVRQEGDGTWIVSDDPGGCYFQDRYWYRLHQ